MEEYVFKDDPIEKDPRYREIFAKIDQETEEWMAKNSKFTENDLGYCQFFWFAKQDILKEKYGIKWKTPAEMNPEVYFD